MWEEHRERHPSWGEAAVTHRVLRPTAPSITASATDAPYGAAEGEEDDMLEEEEEELLDAYQDGAYTQGPAAELRLWSGAVLQQRGPGWTPEPSRPPPLTAVPSATAMMTTTATAATARSHSPAVWVFQDDVDPAAGGGLGGDGAGGMESSNFNNNSLSLRRFSGSVYSDPNQSQRTVQLQHRLTAEAGSADDVSATQAPSPRVLDNRVCAFSRGSSASALGSMDSGDAERGAVSASRADTRHYTGGTDADAANTAAYASGGTRRFYHVPAAAALHGRRRASGAQGVQDDGHNDEGAGADEEEEMDLALHAGSLQGRTAGGAAGAAAAALAANKVPALPSASHSVPGRPRGRALQRSAQPAQPMAAHASLAGPAAHPRVPLRPLPEQQQQQQRRRSSASSATRSTLSLLGSPSLDASTAADEPHVALRSTPQPQTHDPHTGTGMDAEEDAISSASSEVLSSDDVEELYLPGLGPLLLLASVDTRATAAAQTGEETPASSNLATLGSSLEPYRVAGAMLQREMDAHARERTALHARLEAAEQRVRLTEQQVGVVAEARAAELVQGYRADERKRRAQFQATLDTLREENRDLTARLEAAARAPAMGVAATAPSRSLWPASAGEGDAAGPRAHLSEGPAGGVASSGGAGALVSTSELSRQVQSVEAYWRDRLRTAERHWEDEMERQCRQRREALDQVEELVRTVEQTQEELRYTRRQAARLREENTRLCAAAAAAGSDSHTAMAVAAQPGAQTGGSGALGPAEAQKLRQALREHQHREAALLAQVESYGEEATRVRLRSEAALEKAEQELAAERRRSTEMVKLYGSQLESLHRQLREAKARSTAP